MRNGDPGRPDCSCRTPSRSEHAGLEAVVDLLGETLEGLVGAQEHLLRQEQFDERLARLSHLEKGFRLQDATEHDVVLDVHGEARVGARHRDRDRAVERLECLDVSLVVAIRRTEDVVSLVGVGIHLRLQTVHEQLLLRVVRHEEAVEDRSREVFESLVDERVHEHLPRFLLRHSSEERVEGFLQAGHTFGLHRSLSL